MDIQFHEVASIFPLMEGEAYEELKADIKKAGKLHLPIWTYKGKIIDGRNRYRACKELDITAFTQEWGGQGSLVEFVVSLNLHRRHLTAEQKREIVAALLKESPGKSNRQVAAQAKVDDKTVGKVRSELEGRAEIPHVDTRADTRGRKQPAARVKSKKTARTPTPTRDSIEVDALGKLVPKALRDVFGDRSLPDSLAHLKRMRVIARAAANWNPFLMLEDNGRGFVAGLEIAIRAIERAVPYAVHTACQGKGCQECRGEGWLPKWRHEEEQAQKNGAA